MSMIVATAFALQPAMLGTYKLLIGATMFALSPFVAHEGGARTLINDKCSIHFVFQYIFFCYLKSPTLIYFSTISVNNVNIN